MAQRPFSKSNVKHYCASCGKEIPALTDHRYNRATGDRIHIACVRELEVLHKQPQPGTKRAAMPA